MTKKFAIFIPVKNEEANIERCLNSILHSAKDHVEIHVYDDLSTDKTSEMLAEYQEKHTNIHVGKGFGKGPGVIRNFVLDKIKSQYIIYLDGDIEVQEDWFDQVKKSTALMNEKIVAVGGAQRIPKNANAMENFHGALLQACSVMSDHIHEHKEMKEVDHNPLCNVIYERQKLIDAGGFDENLWPGEDLDMDIRLKKSGYQLFYNPEMVVYHHRPDTVEEFQRMLVKYGKAQAYMMKKHGMTQKLHLVPIISFLVLILLLLNPSVIASFLLVGLFLFFTLRTNNILYGLAFPFYAIYSIGSWNYGFIKGLFSK
ncbi:MAG: glycosyltransferase [Bdellovibrionales bacterium]|nr:glycosyltransferase [Bdellovibrionales bacterium]